MCQDHTYSICEIIIPDLSENWDVYRSFRPPVDPVLWEPVYLAAKNEYVFDVEGKYMWNI